MPFQSIPLQTPEGPVVRTPVSANPGLNFNPRFFLFIKSTFWDNFLSILFGVSKYQIVGKEDFKN